MGWAASNRPPLAEFAVRCQRCRSMERTSGHAATLRQRGRRPRRPPAPPGSHPAPRPSRWDLHRKWPQEGHLFYELVPQASGFPYDASARPPGTCQTAAPGMFSIVSRLRSKPNGFGPSWALSDRTVGGLPAISSWQRYRLAVGAVSGRVWREPLAQSWTQQTYVNSDRHKADTACAYPCLPRRELNCRDDLPDRWQARYTACHLR